MTAPRNSPPMNGYLRTKAAHYLEVGPEAYRLGDARGEPGGDLEADVLAHVRIGFEQIVAGRGFERSEALDGVGIEGLYALMRILHFELVGQRAYSEGDDFLDEILFRHRVAGGVVTMFNRVPKLQVQGGST